MVFQRDRDDPEFEDVGSNGHEVAGPERALAVEESGAGGKSKGVKKGKKGRKGANIDDDEYEPSGGNSLDAPEPQQVLPNEELGGVTKKKGGKKGRKGAKIDDDEYDVSGVIEAESTEPEKIVPKDESGGSSKRKGGKKGGRGFDVDDEEYEVVGNNGAEPAVLEKGEPNEESSVGSKKKGGKKGKKGFKVEDDEYEVLRDAPDEQAEPEKTLEREDSGGSSKKKGGKKGSFKADAFALLADLDQGSTEANEIDKDPEQESISGRADDTGNDNPEEIVFTGKKKAKGRKAAKTVQEEDLSNGNLVDNPVPVVSKEEPPKETQPEEEAEEIVFSGKKKPKKGKKDSKKEETVPDSEYMSEASPIVTVKLPSEVPVAAQTSPIENEASDISETVRNSKKKPKKGKKSGRTAQEEEDLDAILAELEGPKIAKPSPSLQADEPSAAETQPLEALGEVENAASAPTTTEADEVVEVESAAAKKKKKKKEKEKEKKAAAVEKPPEEDTGELSTTSKMELSAKSKGAEKKVPKHLKAMQEQLLKIKEAEEKRKREEEERLRKEEEEQARLEELERQREEAKKRRKEREKEKLQQKKKEGKLLTGKQKEEARRLALMREQMLAHAGLPQDGEGGTEEAEVISRAPRKPKYDNKKKRGPVGQHGADHSTDVRHTDSMDVDDNKEENVVEPVELMESETPMEEETVEEKVVEVKDPEPEEEEDDEDWDAKSFEDVALPAIKSAFAEDEVEDEKPVVVAPAGKATKRVVAQAPVVPSITKREPSPEKGPMVPKRPQPKGSGARKGAPPVADESDEEMETEEDTESEEDDDDDDDDDDAQAKKRRLAKEKREARKADALTKRSADDLRSPICCILGHVDTGKTKLLDCIRRTNVQEGEAGGITQQIGATYFPMENIRERTKELKSTEDMKVPGLLVIDTPGHESFTNLRARGSSLCDIAILVVDIMHGLEPQTIESLKLLQMRKTPFVVALNKVDRLYDWRSIQNGPIKNSLKLQGKHVVQEFESRTNGIISQFMEQGMNAELYYKNKDTRKVISIVPTSALSGEGIPDILMLLILLTQKMMEKKLMYVSEVQCTVLEVKMIEGRGTTIDVVLVNGVLHEGDQIVVCGMQGPIVTNIRSLLTPHPMKELRVKGSYEKHKELKAAQGIKITAQGLEHAIAGTQLYVVGPDDDVDDIKEEAMQDMKNVMSRVDKSGEGVCVQASTLGSLEALLEFLKSPAVKIPVSGINIGPVHKKDVMRASVMLERTKKEFATILAFDVKVTQEAKELADELGVRIFTADIIYHLFDQFTNYIGTVKEEKRKESADEAVFPCVLKILPECVFNKKDPIIVGVNVMEGTAKVGTPLCVPSREFIEIGRIASMEVNHKVVDTVKKGQAVAMKIIGTNAEETQKMVGRHFEHEDELVSSITRRSIDLLKENYRDDVPMEDWKLLVKLKVLFAIP